MRKYFYGLFMKFFRNIFLILVFLLISTITYAYEKLDFFDDFHIYTPYIYILQDDTDIDTIKVLVLFHDYEDLENNKETNKKGKKKKNKKDKDIDNNNLDELDDDINNNTDNKQEVYDFETESAKWEVKAERENFFIMGFDFGKYESFFDKENMDKVNDRVLMEIDRIKNTCNTKEVKVYVAGTQFGGNIALLFNLVYDNYDGALCMNILKPTKDIMKKLDKCEKKKFYFFHSEKNKDMNVSKINGIKNKLAKKGAIAEVIIYKNSEDINVLPQNAYFDAINKIR